LTGEILEDTTLVHGITTAVPACSIAGQFAIADALVAGAVLDAAADGFGKGTLE